MQIFFKLFLSFSLLTLFLLISKESHCFKDFAVFSISKELVRYCGCKSSHLFRFRKLYASFFSPFSLTFS
jgi:hypothetical protein